MQTSAEDRGTAPLKATALLLALLGIFPLAAFIKWAPVVRWLPEAAGEWAITMPAVLVLAVVLARAAPDRVDSMLARAREAVLSPRDRDFALYAALFTFLASLSITWFAFGGQPVGGDEMTQRFQVRLLLAGRLWGVAEQPFEFFSGIQTANVDGRWFAQFPIGGPSLLAVGALFGMPWIVNPMLAGWTAASVHQFASRTQDPATARFATMLFALSPFVLLMSGSQMNHVGTVAFVMFGLVAVVDWVRATDAAALRNAALRIGFAFAATAAIRPYDAAALGVVVGIFQVAHARRSMAHARSFLWQLAGGALPMAFLMYANAQQTGNPFLFGYDVVNSALHRPGFHADPTGVDFTPDQGLHHISSYLLLLNVSLFAGPIPALFLIVTALLVARRATTWDHLLVGLIVAVVVAYTLYWAESFFVGPRFLYSAVPFFVLFAARLPRELSARMRSPVAARAARLILPLSIAFAWVLPARVTRWQGAWTAFAGERASNAQQRFDVAAAARAEGLQDALVIVHEGWHGRLTARLRAMGAPGLTAEAMLREFDACGLHVGLDEQDRAGGPPSLSRLNRVIARAWMAGEAELLPGTDGSTALAFAPDRPIHPYCLVEMEVDADGAVPLDRFLPHARFDRDGRLGGSVVYARDFGPRNNQLLRRFGDRTWYRYRPRTGPDDQSPVFVPYGPR